MTLVSMTLFWGLSYHLVDVCVWETGTAGLTGMRFILAFFITAIAFHGKLKEIDKTKRYRIELIQTINKVSKANLSELGELDDLVVSSLRIAKRIEDIQYLLELVESELDLLYNTNTNRMVNLLTVLGLVLAVAQVLLGIMAL